MTALPGLCSVPWDTEHEHGRLLLLHALPRTCACGAPRTVNGSRYMIVMYSGTYIAVCHSLR